MSDDTRLFHSEDESGAWMLCRADADALDMLLQELWTWRAMVTSGRHLLALGAVIAAIEAILEKEEFGCSVRIGWTRRPDMMEGVSVDIAVSDEGIELGQTEYVPTGQGNSCDHGSTVFAFLNADGGFSMSQIERWLELVGMVKGEGSKFDASIDGLPYD